MKIPRKNLENLFICEECNKTYVKFDGLSKHIGIYHNKKEYYDKYLKENNEDICPICNNKNLYLNRWDRGYKKTCSKKCANILRQQLLEKTNLDNYSVKYSWQREEIRDKINETFIKRYGNKCPAQNKNIQKRIKEKNLINLGVENPLQSKEIQRKGAKTRKEKYGAEYTWQSDVLMNKIKQTNIQKYGYEYPSQNKNIKEKIRKTTKEHTGYDYNFQNRKLMKTSLTNKYGVENIAQLQETKEKIIKTNLFKYGYTHHLQNIDIFEKGQKTRLLRKQYNDTKLTYQGSYELDFLEKYYNIYSDIQRGPTIKYHFNGKNKVYFPDFFIPSLNLVIECKNTYLLKRDKILCKLKKKATLANGFNYIVIVDKKYNKFEKLIKSLS